MSRVVLQAVTKLFDGTRMPAVRDVSLSIEAGELVALVGESGCGKTTLLRVIAGFEDPTTGRILLGEREICNSSGGLLPEERHVGLVFQEASLFPHLTVRDNVAFGLHKLPPNDRRRRSDQLLELVGLTDLANRHPHEISGGQAQRAALARALAPSPEVLLMDEPFSSLDVILKRRLILEVRDILAATGTTALLVTHERNDAFAFAERIAVMRRGALLQVGTPADLYTKPRNAYVANFLGRANMLRVEQTPDGLDTALGAVPDRLAAVCDGRVPVRPDQLVLAEPGSGRLNGIIARITFLGEYREIVVNMADGNGIGELVVHVPRDRPVNSGDEVSVRFKPVRSYATIGALSDQPAPVRVP